MFKVRPLYEFTNYKVSPLKSELLSKYPDIIDNINLYQSDEAIELNLIKLRYGKKGLGKGREILNIIMQYADDNNLTVHLTPTDEFGSNLKRLTNFYRELGFVNNKGKNKELRTKDTMIRYPS
jgi:hypothetical protein